MMTEEQKLLLALSMAEVAAGEMREAGLDPKHIAIGLASEMQRQCSLAMPTASTARAFLAALSVPAGR